MGGSSKPAAPQPFVPPPKQVDEGVLMARSRARARASLARGRSATILTSPSGLKSATTEINKEK